MPSPPVALRRFQQSDFDTPLTGASVAAARAAGGIGADFGQAARLSLFFYRHGTRLATF